MLVKFQTKDYNKERERYSYSTYIARQPLPRRKKHGEERGR
jgi:hypothetical protein